MWIHFFFFAEGDNVAQNEFETPFSAIRVRGGWSNEVKDVGPVFEFKL